MEHQALILTLLLLGAGVVAAALYIIRRWWNPLSFLERYLPQKGKCDWLVGIAAAITLVGLFSWTDGRDQRLAARLEQIERQAAMERAGFLRPDRARLTVNLNDCPPKTPGMTDQIVMAIATQADGKHIVHGCSRISARGYLAGGAVKMAGR